MGFIPTTPQKEDKMLKKLRAILATWWDSNWFNESDQDQELDLLYDDELDQNRRICGFAERKSEPHGR